MATLANLNPFSTFTELDGDALDNGYIYVGVAGQNPKQFPITVYWDEFGTVPAQQPLRTNGGYVTRSGKPAQVYVNSSYSILVEDKKRKQVFYVASYVPPELRGALQKVNTYADLRNYTGLEPNLYVASRSDIGDGGDGVFYYDPTDTTTPDNDGTVLVGISGKRFKRQISGFVSSSWFASGDGITPNTAEIQAADSAAAAAGCKLVFTPGDAYVLSSSHTFVAPVEMLDGSRLKTTTVGAWWKFSAGFTAPLSYCLDTDQPTQFLKTERIYPEWFGATGKNADDQSVALTRAFRATRAACASSTSHPDSDYGARIVRFSSGVYRGNDVPIYCGTIIEGEWQGSLFGSTLTQIDFTKPLFRVMPKNYSLTNAVLNDSVGQNDFRRIGFRSEVASSVTEGAPLLYFMSPAQATSYLGIPGDGVGGNIGHIDTFITESWFKDGNTCIMCDEGMLWIHVLDCTFDVCRRAVQHKGTAKGRVNSRGNYYYAMTWGALDNQSSEASLGVSWEIHGDEYKAGNTSNGTADYRRALNYNPSVVAPGTTVRIRGAHFRRTDGLGTRIGGPILIRNAETVDIEVFMKDPDSQNDQKAIAIQEGVKYLRINGMILSESLANYTNSRLIQISQNPQTLVDIAMNVQLINTNASSIATAVHGNFVTTGVDLDRTQFSGNFTERIGVNISGRPRFVPTVASAAAVTLPPGSDVFSISGTTTITSIVATGWAGKIVTLVFQGALTVTDGGNILIAGNFVTSADDSITLVCDGTNWREVARSVN